MRRSRENFPGGFRPDIPILTELSENSKGQHKFYWGENVCQYTMDTVAGYASAF